MKRHPGLQSLSSDHHQGLVQARRLEQAGAKPALDRTTIAAAFVQFWAEHTVPHFRVEEEVLLPTFARYGDPAQPPIVQILVEHVQIRSLVATLRQELAAGAVTDATLHALGAGLRTHIRYEEAVVFPLIEAALPEEVLADLVHQLAHDPHTAMPAVPLPGR